MVAPTVVSFVRRSPTPINCRFTSAPKQQKAYAFPSLPLTPKRKGDLNFQENIYLIRCS